MQSKATKKIASSGGNIGEPTSLTHRPVQRASAFPVDTSLEIAALAEKYQRTGRAIPVSFRKLVHWLKVGERATHYLHPYPAKLLPHIAHFFLASKTFSPARGLVLDPFGGSGTVALESCLSGRAAAYADTNPLAHLIAEVKSCAPVGANLSAALEDLGSRYRKSRTSHHPAVVNIKKWFQPEVVRSLARLRAAIEGEISEEVRQLFRVTFSATVRRVSNADPRLSVPVLAKPDALKKAPADVWQRFCEQFAANLRRIEELGELLPGKPEFSLAGPDARHLLVDAGGNLEPRSVDLVVTSPPYAGAQKYIRASSLCLGWLGIAEEGKLKPLERNSIGREHLPKAYVDTSPVTSVPAANKVISRIRKLNPTRAAICAAYLNEMEVVIEQLQAVLKPGGRLVLVIGNNEVCGEKFLSSEYLSSMLLERGFVLEIKLVDEIKSRGLMTKRNKTASVITREWVLVFQKSKKNAENSAVS